MWSTILFGFLLTDCRKRSFPRMLSPSDNSESESDHGASTSSAALIANRHSVKRAAIQRDRFVAKNQDPPKRCHQQVKRGWNNPKTVSVQERILAFPREYFEQRKGQLFCGACEEFVSLKLTTVKTHIRTAKHVAGKKRCATSRSSKSASWTL